jgi:rod shape determining protein RodA
MARLGSLSDRFYSDEDLVRGIDWVLVAIYTGLVLIGWLNIFAAVYDPQSKLSIFDLSINSGKQLLWIGTSVLLIIAIMVIDFKFFENFAYPIYILMIVVLIAVIGLGSEVKGSRSWFKIGTFLLQPAEFSKMTTALCLARYLSVPTVRLDRRKDLLFAAAIIIFPAAIILLQNETGSALVFGAFVLVLFREGLPAIIPGVGLLGIVLFILALLVPQVWLLAGIGLVMAIVILLVPKNFPNIVSIVIAGILVSGVVVGVDYFVNDVLQPHQQNRIKVLFNPDIDPLGTGWNVTQSKIAIGSGGMTGKGFLEGTQTKFDFVPEQSTDFIFCTIGEEHGWIGSVVVIALFVALLYRIIFVAERQKSRFGRVYAYGVASIIFFHFMVNIGMTIGLFPVIGIPLPFFSYGGSSLWSFTILLWILLKIDAHRGQVLNREL